MQYIGDWLGNLGLTEYTKCFMDNKIDVSVLRYLTDQDLKEIGIPLGHRRKILAAISELTVGSATTHEFGDVKEPVTRAAERRQVTVMFLDLVDSVGLSARMDPEDLREVISAYQNCAAETVGHFDGFVARYMGDGVLAFFGYPRAQEDDAERAVRAGLELIAAVAGLKTRASLQARVGIATGLVVVGDLIGSGDTRERGIVGDTPNLAARLQGIAEPNMVVICDVTRRILGDLFEVKDLGLRDLKGFVRPMRSWAALRANSGASRFEALHATSLITLVGRDEELELLLRRWKKAKSGEGQLVLLCGEAGIGKSRLTFALQESIGAETHARLSYFSSPQHIDSVFYPIIGQMERAAGLAHNDTPQAKLDKLDAILAQTSTSNEDSVLLAEMLSLQNDGRYAVLDYTPEQRRQRTMDALISRLQTLARAGPVLIISEDAHWTDPTSLDVLDRVVRSIATLRALLIVTYRPEFDPPWIGQSHVTAITLNRLPQREIGAMIDDLVGSKVLPMSIRQDLIERSDGIPLFVEEMTKAVLEAGSQNAAERAVAAIPSHGLAVPATLHASLMARLDRLGAAKEVAQIGAAIGREFSHALLAAVTRKPEAELRAALDSLIAAGLLFRHGVPPHASYLFKHSLIQDAAYGMQLREPRRVLHARIVEILESQFASIAEPQPELLAHHCTEAALVEKAATLWGKAGQRALERSALVEATEHLTRALAQIAALPSTPALRRKEIQLQVALITPLMHVKGYAAPETKVAAERARLLIEEAEARGEHPDDPLLLFSVLFSFWTASFVAFDGDALRERASQFLTLAEKRKAIVPIMIGHRIMGSVLHTGAFVEGRTHLDRAIALYDPAEHRPLATRFGQDVRVAALSYRSWALWMLGHPDAGLVDTGHALEEAREIGQAATLMYALVHALLIHMLCGNYAAAKEEADELIALGNEKNALFWTAQGMSMHGCILAATGEAADAVQMISSGITAWRSTGSTFWMPLYLSYLARAHAELGQFESASRCIDEAMTAAEMRKERWHQAEICRLAGEIALQSPAPDLVKAEVYFERGLAIARAQQAKSWELRAAMSLARLWRHKGKGQQGRDQLVSILGWFTEGFDTLDLREASALLELLASEGNGMGSRFDSTNPVLVDGYEVRKRFDH
jgi:class 3 adenylate cyclase/predicted ATPase